MNARSHQLDQPFFTINVHALIYTKAFRKHHPLHLIPSPRVCCISTSTYTHLCDLRAVECSRNCLSSIWLNEVAGCGTIKDFTKQSSSGQFPRKRGYWTARSDIPALNYLHPSSSLPESSFAVISKASENERWPDIERLVCCKSGVGWEWEGSRNIPTEGDWRVKEAKLWQECISMRTFYIPLCGLVGNTFVKCELKKLKRRFCVTRDGHTGSIDEKDRFQWSSIVTTT